MGFTISSDREQGYTKISNYFIQTYMTAANGSYVKIYLYLQMLCQHPGAVGEDVRETATLKGLADKMEGTEGDILRALRYWKKQGLLEWTEQNGEICEITLREPADCSSPDVFSSDIISPNIISPEASPSVPHTESGEDASAPPKEMETARTGSAYTAPEKRSYTPLQAEALRKDIEIDKAIQQVEALLGEPVSPAHLQLILYFMCDIGFTADLLTTLYETALHKGKKKPSYIEAIGISWASQGIKTPGEAKSEASAFSGKYSLVAKELGFTNSLPPVSRELIDSWDGYGFSDEMIREACRRSARHTGGGADGLTYASKILKRWNEQNVRTTEDIQKEDESFRRQRKNTAPKTIPAKNKFQNFPQRIYSPKDYASLEKRLLQKQ